MIPIETLDDAGYLLVGEEVRSDEHGIVVVLSVADGVCEVVGASGRVQRVRLESLHRGRVVWIDDDD